jgi:hypothetical protein
MADKEDSAKDERESQTETPGPSAPPVGLNWATVAAALGVDERVLRHDGQIILPGEYFPEEGFFIDTGSFRARHVDVGDIALKPGYFLSDLSMSEFGIRVPIEAEVALRGHPIVPRPSGSVIGLFADERAARRVKDRIVRGSMGAGVSIETGPLGIELRVEKPELLGRVATIIAAHGGAVTAYGGSPVPAPSSAAPATSSSAVGGHGDAIRGGTGAASDSEGPQPRIVATEVEGD